MAEQLATEKSSHRQTEEQLAQMTAALEESQQAAAAGAATAVVNDRQHAMSRCMFLSHVDERDRGPSQKAALEEAALDADA